jgi:hypothetical protein
MPTRYVSYHGMKVLRGWPAKLRAAQARTTYIIEGEARRRVRYGDDWGPQSHACHDCAAITGQFHAIGCDVEQCPLCGEPILSCGCVYQDHPNKA